MIVVPFLTRTRFRQTLLMRLIQFWIPNCNRVVDRPGLVGYIEDTDDGFDVVGAALGFCVGTRRSKPPTPLL